MRKFETPEMEVLRFSFSDIITTSSDPGVDELPIIPQLNEDHTGLSGISK